MDYELLIQDNLLNTEQMGVKYVRKKGCTEYLIMVFVSDFHHLYISTYNYF
jgi:hypothetical protein